MSNDHPQHARRRRRRAAARNAGAGGEPHLFDRLSVLYKYRWARDRRVHARRRLGDGRQLHAHSGLSRDGARADRRSERRHRHARPKSRAACRSAIPRSTCRRSCASCAAATWRSASPPKLDMNARPRIQRPGPEADAARRRHRAGQVLRDLAVSPDHVDAGRRAGDRGQLRRRSARRAIRDALLARLDVAQVRGSQLVDMTFDVGGSASSRRGPSTRSPTSTSRTTSSSRCETLEKSAEWLTGEVEKQGELVRRASSSSRSTRKRRTPARSTATRTSSSRG